MTYDITATEAARLAKWIATDVKTLYVLGGFGAPIVTKPWNNVSRFYKSHPWNETKARKVYIEADKDQDPPFYAFDCCGLWYGILWGFSADPTARYGGTNTGADNFTWFGASTNALKACTEYSDDFSKIQVGEMLWLDGHVGVYIGDGLAVECSPAWANKVQITAVGNIGAKTGYKTRNWTYHGKLKWVQFLPQVGDTVKVTGTTWTNGKTIPAWVRTSKKMYVRRIEEKDGKPVLLISKYAILPAYTGRVWATDAVITG